MTATVIDGTAREIEAALPESPPPGVPADAAPFIIPEGMRFVAIVIGEGGKAQITVRGIEHDAAMRVMVRCSLVVWDDGQAADAKMAQEAADAP